MKKFDRPLYGFITGLVLPLFGFMISKFIQGPNDGWGTHLNYLLKGKTYQDEIFTMTMIPTLLFFYLIFFQWKLDHAAKGFIAISLIYVAGFMALKFL